MKVLILSDLHLEFGTFLPPEADYDVVILAGDIAVPARKAVRWARREAVFGLARGVVYVPGNHEFYADVMPTALGDMHEAAAGSNVHTLDCGEWIFEGVRFLGCTLWTDFALQIEVSGQLTSHVSLATALAQRHMSDYQLIRTHVGADEGLTNSVRRKGVLRASDKSPKALKRHLRAADTLAINGHHRAWLLERLGEPFDGPTVVVTHHAPHRGSLAPNRVDDWISCSYVNELPVEFFEVPVLWVHGHTHDSFDYQVGNCRVVCNPRGYMLGHHKEPQNADFNPGFVVDLDALRAARS